MSEAILNRRLYDALDTASLLAPIAGRGRAKTSPGLGARLASRIRYGAASLFTARQKRFNLEITDAVRQIVVTDPNADQIKALTARLDETIAQLAGVTAQLEDLRLTSEPPHFRAGTWDHLIWAGIVRGIEYELPASFDPQDVIIDIGTHIGSFSFACLTRGAGKVYGFETHPHNHALALTNVSRFGGRGEIFNKAMWRSDEKPGTVKFMASQMCENTGGGCVLDNGITYHYTDKDWVEVAAVCFDEFIDGLPARLGRPNARVRMLKMDCEGSEYPILLTSKRLHLIDEVVGEFHEGEYTAEAAKKLGVTKLDRSALKNHLEAAGFTVKIKEHSSSLGTFHAVRKAAA